ELELDEPAAHEATEPDLERAPVAMPRRAAPPAPVAAHGAPFRGRLFAGLVDLGVHALAAAAALGGARLLGVVPAPSQAPGFALLVLVFSLFYTVVPLAFWGRTPGLLAAGLACRAAGD